VTKDIKEAFEAIVGSFGGSITFSYTKEGICVTDETKVRVFLSWEDIETLKKARKHE
jgi:hypothetical protein